MKEIKFNQNSRVIITEDTGKTQQVRNLFSGEIVNQKVVKKYVVEDTINLGSLVNPNKKILNIRIEVPRRYR